MYHPSSNVFMTNKTLSDAEKHHENAEPENSKTARMFFFILFFLSFFLPFFLPFFLSSFPFSFFSFFPFFLFSFFPFFLLSFFPSFLLSFFPSSDRLARYCVNFSRWFIHEAAPFYTEQCTTPLLFHNFSLARRL